MSLANGDGTAARVRKPRREPWSRDQLDAHRDHLLDHLFHVGAPDPASPGSRRRYSAPELAAIFRVDPSTVRRAIARYAAQQAALRRAAQ